MSPTNVTTTELMTQLIVDDTVEDSEKCINNHSHVTNMLSELYKSEELSDVTLQVGEKQFKVHKVILSGYSNVFKVLLLDKNWTECKESVVTLHEDPDCVEVFEDFLKYLYTGEIKRDGFIILPLLKLADKYNIRALSAICLTFMSQHLVYATATGLILAWFQYCLVANHVETSECCKDVITPNFHMLSEKKTFTDLDCASLVILLQSSDIVVDDEKTLFQ